MVVVGAGITGLAAAYELRCAGIEAGVLEASDRAGGKIDESQIGPLTVDSGPDGFIARDPAAAELCRRIGLGHDLVEPAVRGAHVWVDGRLRPLPERSLLGVPWTADAVAGTGIVSEESIDVLRSGLARDAAPVAADATVGDVLRPRVGDEVFERLVDPLLGGINAGSADEMSIEACAPLLYQAVSRGGPLGQALKEVAARGGGPADGPTRPTASEQVATRRSSPGDEPTGPTASEEVEAREGPGHDGASGAPVFQSVRGGVTRIIDTLAAELGDSLELDTPVQSVKPASAGPRWAVSTPAGALEADAVILACPAWESARLLEPLAPDAAQVLGGIEYSDVVLATFTVERERLVRPLNGSGFLVPRDQGLLMTACSWASSKWAHYAHEDVALLRVSAGRTDDRRWLDLDHAELVAALAGELAETRLIEPEDAGRGRFDVRVTPWPRSLPQYRPGHLGRVAEVDASLAEEAPGLIVAGAALRGLGLPACIRSAQAAAERAARAVLC